VLVWVWLQFELVCDDPRNTVLIMHPSLSHFSFEGEDQRRDEEVCKCYGDDFLGYGDDEVRVSDVWEEREGETSGMASEVCVDKSMC